MNDVSFITGGNILDPMLEIRKGNVPGHSTASILGHNEMVGTDFGTLWEEETGTGVPMPSSPGQMTVSSSSANDDLGNTGLTTVLITYVDENFVIQTETVQLNGQTGVISFLVAGAKDLWNLLTE